MSALVSSYQHRTGQSATLPDRPARTSAQDSLQGPQSWHPSAGHNNCPTSRRAMGGLDQAPLVPDWSKDLELAICGVQRFAPVLYVLTTSKSPALTHGLQGAELSPHRPLGLVTVAPSGSSIIESRDLHRKRVASQNLACQMWTTKLVESLGTIVQLPSTKTEEQQRKNTPFDAAKGHWVGHACGNAKQVA